jgi:hypothetical protein
MSPQLAVFAANANQFQPDFFHSLQFGSLCVSTFFTVIILFILVTGRAPRYTALYFKLVKRSEDPYLYWATVGLLILCTGSLWALCISEWVVK